MPSSENLFDLCPTPPCSQGCRWPKPPMRQPSPQRLSFRLRFRCHRAAPLQCLPLALRRPPCRLKEQCRPPCLQRPQARHSRPIKWTCKAMEAWPPTSKTRPRRWAAATSGSISRSSCRPPFKRSNRRRGRSCPQGCRRRGQSRNVAPTFKTGRCCCTTTICSCSSGLNVPIICVEQAPLKSDDDQKQIAMLKKENAELRAEVFRLRRQGKR